MLYCRCVFGLQGVRRECYDHILRMACRISANESKQALSEYVLHLAVAMLYLAVAVLHLVVASLAMLSIAFV